MANIEINYTELISDYNYVNDKINELLFLVESIEKCCNDLCKEGYWEGALSTSFNSLNERIHKDVVQNILNLKETEEYKKIYMTSFVELENNSSTNYV